MPFLLDGAGMVGRIVFAGWQGYACLTHQLFIKALSESAWIVSLNNGGRGIPTFTHLVECSLMC